MNRSAEIEKLAAALVKAQQEMQNPVFDKVNPHLRSQYASLRAVRDAVIPVFAKHGISVVQFPKMEADRAGCETILMHESGQWQGEVLLLPVSQLTGQGSGGAITYSRRYSLQAVAGVCGETDDDGESNQPRKQNKNKNPETPFNELTPVSIPATTGAFEGLDEAEQKIVISLAAEINKHFISGEDLNGYEKYVSFKESAEADGRNEKVIALWSMLKPCKSAITKIGKERSAIKSAAKA
jgi:hypothetical protein